jgi:hypothetical protein
MRRVLIYRNEVLAIVFRELLFRGLPRLGSTLLFLGFALTPTKLRVHLRQVGRGQSRLILSHASGQFSTIDAIGM